ncbi:chemotaxis protein CheX [Rhodohalobacter sp. SW132]|uniref:chemotaxis protein CheX n=1 Tax=Rhodohalobacter sp. SW132 TaxID=2293433 RepID=UPI000E2416F4|nr:chemotaxis protein CheX [Rhodohalobacter sp. SW132]REL38701.1 chemotaxis protein CheX [Rhodohalobacter sp. SW132]
MVALHEDKLRGIAYRTFEITCYMYPLEEWELEDLSDEERELNDNSITALVEFDGAAKGAMSIRVSPELLDAISENMLGMEEGTDELKEGALCEIANIICGNTVPVFAKGDNICYIRSPRIIEDHTNPGQELMSMQNECLQIYLDEGVAELTIYYSTD